MLSLEPELIRLRELAVSGDTVVATAPSPLIAAERREVVSVYAELRLLTWAGVILVSIGIGVLISNHLDEIGPLAIAGGIGLAAAACYAWAFWKRRQQAGLIDEYVLLLGALLVSADLGYIEHQFHLLGARWAQHFLLLAVLHGVTAYVFQSRLVLSLSVAALASWLGIERRSATSFFDAPVETAIRAFVCASIIAIWRTVDARMRPATTFSSLFDNAAANLAFWGALTLAAHDQTRFLGCLIAVALAAASMVYAQRAKAVPFLIYAWVYGTIAVDIAICTALHEEGLIMLYLMVSTVGAIVGLFVSHARLKRASV